ncbi:MAG: PorV/PorQ family protein, partial [Candidatus Eisenbacteria bacterium]|nr:PorV/PorQ family protein [Candidatus Eisenbacteria bacterium]
MTRALVVTLAVAVLMAAPCAEAQVSIGGAQSLYIQPGGRPAGMGDCYAAVAEDASACYWNPAGLAFMPVQKNLILMHSELVPDWGDVYYEYAAYAQKVEGLGTLAGSVTYLTYGEQVATEEGSPDPVGTFNSYEVIPSLAYATTLTENIAMGINLKFIWVDLAPESVTFGQGEGSGTTFAGDLGVLYRMGAGRLRLGSAIQNVGPKIAYIDEEQSDPLPRNWKLGASYKILDDEMNELLVCGEYNKSLVIYEDFFDFSTGVILNAGVEYRYYDLLSLRAGYVYDEDGEIKDFS